MHLYSTLRDESDLTSDVDWGWLTFGKTSNFVALMCLGILPILKSCCIVAHTIRPIKCQVDLNKPLLYPLGLRDLTFTIEKIASLISLLLKLLHIWTCCSPVRTVPCSITSLFIALLECICFPSSSFRNWLWLVLLVEIPLFDSLDHLLWSGCKWLVSSI